MSTNTHEALSGVPLASPVAQLASAACAYSAKPAAFRAAVGFGRLVSVLQPATSATSPAKANREARAHVADLAAVESARRIGVGRALMRAGEAWARERGMSVLSLDVWSTNERALAFYERLGYHAESLCLVKALG